MSSYQKNYTPLKAVETDPTDGWPMIESEHWFHETMEMVNRGYRRFCRRRGLPENEWKEVKERQIRSAIAERTLKADELKQPL